MDQPLLTSDRNLPPPTSSLLSSWNGIPLRRPKSPDPEFSHRKWYFPIVYPGQDFIHGFGSMKTCSSIGSTVCFSVWHVSNIKQLPIWITSTMIFTKLYFFVFYGTLFWQMGKIKPTILSSHYFDWCCASDGTQFVVPSLFKITDQSEQNKNLSWQNPSFPDGSLVLNLFFFLRASNYT